VLSSTQTNLFRCLPPGSDETLTDSKTYRTEKGAIAAAKRFIDGRIKRGEIGEALDNLVEQGQLDPETHASLLTALAESAQNQLSA
jgi:hypothetical protein